MGAPMRKPRPHLKAIIRRKMRREKLRDWPIVAAQGS
jgi:hypothetical protein